MDISEQAPLLGGPKTTTNKKKPSPWYIIAPMFSVTFAFGALMAPMIQFYTVVFCYKYYEAQKGSSLDGENDLPSIEDCAIPEVQAIVSKAQAIIMFLSYTACLLSAGFLGSLSDRKGRRFVILISGLGNIILMIAYLVTISYAHIFGISLLYIAPMIRGLVGGDNVLVVTAQAYISDCTSPTKRTIAFGHLIAAIFLGATLGPPLSSYVLKETGSITNVFLMVLFVSTLFELYAFFILPESHDFEKFKVPQKNTTFLQRINIFSALNILFRTSSEHANKHALPFIAGVQFMLNIVMMPPTLLYAMLVFGWTAYEGGLYISSAAFTRLLVMVLILPLVSKLFHKNRASVNKDERNRKTSVASATSSSTVFSDKRGERTKGDKSKDLSDDDKPHTEEDIKHSIRFDIWMVRIGMSIEALGLIGIGTAPSSAGVVVAGCLQSFALLGVPSLKSLLTTLVKPSEIGELMGAIAVLESIAMIMSQFGLNAIYSMSVKVMPQLTFYICAILAFVGAFLTLFVYPTSLKPATDNDTTSNSATVTIS
ncbi:putative membrane protein C14C4.07 [Choanephora cucurbitarum]|uniref:Putative membrane protein C14C4.07 n=1 Tax=Choanephora cucurbitarum TaxID=101091 RepID=A0A1C7NIK0_9FUNG|nr:putative membrane protein C14C4.07 [Choanephora cucurbitarum]